MPLWSCCFLLFFQAEDGIRDLVRSRGLGDVYKRQLPEDAATDEEARAFLAANAPLYALPARVQFKQLFLSLIHI